MVRQQFLPRYKITFSQSYGIIGQVGTFETAEHNPVKTQIRGLFISSYVRAVCQDPIFRHSRSGLITIP